MDPEPRIPNERSTEDDMPKRTGAQRQLLSDDEIRQRMKDNPEVQKRVQEALARSNNGSRKDAGITADELRDFLRDHEKGVDSRPEVPE
jgi:hypothetical protein